MSWVFMVSDRRYGNKAIVSPNYDEAYVITRHGTWVPEKDAKYLETIKWRCPQCGDAIRVFSRGNPTAAQMALMPSRKPKRKARQVKVESEPEVSFTVVVENMEE